MTNPLTPLRALATASPPALQEGQLAPLSCDLSGTLRTTAGGGGGGGIAGDVTIHDAGTPTRFLAISAGGAASVTGTISVGNFPATQAVTGTFWQATQPVSAASLPLPSGASTEATLALIKAKTDNLDVALSTRTKPADTQTISGSVSVSNFPATQAVSLATAPTTPVTGTFWQTTQPIQYQTPTVGALTAASVSVAVSGDNTLVAGVSAKTVRVFRLLLVVAGAVNIQFKAATGGTALTGVMTMSAGGSLVLDFSGEPWFVTATAGAFVLNLSAAVQVSGAVWFTQS